jgi:hypothetical protein
MASDPYCPAAHPGGGWLCILRRDHDGPHLSLDNRQRWRGTVGLPVRWQAMARDLPMAEHPPATNGHPAKAPRPSPPVKLALPEPTGQALGYTGIPCDACGGPNTVRSGKCLTCMDCHAAGECG